MASDLYLPPEIRRLIGTCELVPEKSGWSGASVYRCGNLFLKTDECGKLHRAMVMTEYFAGKGLTAPVISYVQADGRDYLLMQGVQGEQGFGGMLKADPQRTAEKYGECIRALHEQPFEDCPMRDLNDRMLKMYIEENGKPFEGSTEILKNDVLAHGDCCLPNVFFEDYRFSGFIDCDEAGVGDRHFDLVSAQWSMAYNAGTDQWNDRILDAYGRDMIDEARLELCRAIHG